MDPQPPLAKPINMSALTRKISVDNRLSLGYYYRIANNLLKQANVYREGKNIVDLYVTLLRFLSLVLETIPFHQDYQTLHSRERTHYKKNLVAVLDEMETLKPEFQRRVDELNKAHTEAQQYQFVILETTSNGSEASTARPSAFAPSFETKQLQPESKTYQ